MLRINTLLKVTFHALLWALLYLLNYIFTKNYDIQYDFLTEFLITTIYAIIFYVNYYFLMPLLYKKKVLIYVALSILLISGALILKRNLNRNRFERIHPERFENRAKPPLHKPNFMLKPGDPEYRPKDMKDHRILFDSYGLLLFFALSFSMRFIQKWQDDERNKLELEKEKVKTELSYLKQQINPHFLFNSLNSIYSLSLSKSDVTTSSILKLSSILRYMLYESEDSLVSLKDEIRTIQDYFDLQKLRLTNKVSINLQINGNAEGYKIAPFMLIPLIENAFKYGVDNVNESFINIVLSIKDSKLKLKVTNNIVSNNIKQSKNSGIGLKNIQRRLELLYPHDYTFETTKSQSVFTVLLELKLKT
jgi:two-component system, LytTR family, sensor kinase